MHIKVAKIVLHKRDDMDMVWVFTTLIMPGFGDYFALQIPCPKDQGERWIASTFGIEASYQTVTGQMEIIAP